jgi:hypothetical protein
MCIPFKCRELFEKYSFSQTYIVSQYGPSVCNTMSLTYQVGQMWNDYYLRFLWEMKNDVFALVTFFFFENVMSNFEKRLWESFWAQKRFYLGILIWLWDNAFLTGSGHKYILCLIFTFYTLHHTFYILLPLSFYLLYIYIYIYIVCVCIYIYEHD